MHVYHRYTFYDKLYSTVATDPVPVRFRSGPVPVRFRSGSGRVPVWFRSGSGPVPVRFWSGPVSSPVHIWMNIRWISCTALVRNRHLLLTCIHRNKWPVPIYIYIYTRIKLHAHSRAHSILVEALIPNPFPKSFSSHVCSFERIV